MRLSLLAMTWNDGIFDNPLFAPFFYHLQILEINSTLPDEGVLNALSYFHELRELKLFFVNVPPIAHDVDLPLARTLQKLSLSSSSLEWMDGMVFTQLQRLTVDEYDWPQTFKPIMVAMPVCTHIVYEQFQLENLHVLQSYFHLPLLDTFEFSHYFSDFQIDKKEMSEIQRIHAKTFRFRMFTTTPNLFRLMESKDEVEQLDLIIESSIGPSPEIAGNILTMMSMSNNTTRKVPCPNMKVLRLQFDDNIEGADRERVSQSCRQMMNVRQLAGYSMERCYIWWSYGDWDTVGPSALVMENEVVRTEKSSL